MRHNARKVVWRYPDGSARFMVVGPHGRDGVPGTDDDGQIRYKLDRDWQVRLRWAAYNGHAVAPAYASPFTLGSQEYAPGIPVVGTTGPNDQPVADRSGHYQRGILDPFGDEWHVLAYASDNSAYQKRSPDGVAVQPDWWVNDGKTVLLVVNPRTPCLTVRAGAGGRFFTTAPKAYFTPRVVAQTTYLSGPCSLELRDIYGRRISYRIDDGPWHEVGADHATLDGTQFPQGSSRLEYRSEGCFANAKVRTVVRDPPHPSLAERHGDLLWKDADGYAATVSRLARRPYRKWWELYNTRRDVQGARQAEFDGKLRSGLRHRWGAMGVTTVRPCGALINAFLARVNGGGFKVPGATKTSAQYAVEMILESSMTIDPVGAELDWVADAFASAEVNYRGYYDAEPVIDAALAYDIIAADLRSDQVAGGLTPVDDQFVRERFAAWAYIGMLWSGGFGTGATEFPRMWGGARMIGAAIIGMAMPEYSSPACGTSGFGKVQTTYPLCPYPVDQLTWRKALFDGDAPRSAYPNYKYDIGIESNDPNALFLRRGQQKGKTEAGPLYTWDMDGVFTDKTSYLGIALFGKELSLFTTLAAMHQGRRWNRFEQALQAVAQGGLHGAVLPAKYTGDYPGPKARPVLLLNCNASFPAFAAAQVAWLQSRQAMVEDDEMPYAGVLGFALYDDSLGR